MKAKPTKKYHSGWDHFTPDAGKVEEMSCRVCGKKMTVKRNVMGPTGWAEAMSVHHGNSKGHLHDSFSCKYAQEDWHNQVRILKERIDKETSQTLAHLLEEELKVVMETKKTTRDRPWKYL